MMGNKKARMKRVTIMKTTSSVMPGTESLLVDKRPLMSRNMKRMMATIVTS